MKKFSIILILAALGGGVWYFLSGQQGSDNNGDLWELLPGDAVMVMEAEHSRRTYQKLQSNKILQDLKDRSFFKRLNHETARLDSVIKSGAFTRDHVLISAHPKSDYAWDLLYSSYVRPKKFKAFAGQDAVSKRKYLEHTIYSFSFGKDNFAFTRHGNRVAGSFNSLLVKKTIRQLKEQKKYSGGLNELNLAGSVQDSSVKVFLKYNKSPRLFGSFLPVAPENETLLRHLASATGLEAEISNEKVFMSGFTSLDGDTHHLLDIFKDQESQPLTLKNYIPQNTGLFYHFGFDKSSRLHKSLETYFGSYDSGVIEKRQTLKKQYDFPLSRFYNLLKDEVGWALVSRPEYDKTEKLLYLKTDYPDSLKRIFRRLNKHVENQSGKKHKNESAFSGIAYKELPAHLFGSAFKGFSTSYLWTTENLVILANRPDALKNLKADIEQENVWGKSVAKNLFLGSCLKESNLSLYMDISRAKDYYKKQSRYSHNIFDGLDNVSNAAFQFSRTGNRFYTSLNVRASGGGEEHAIASGDFIQKQKNEFIHPLRSSPFLIKNYVNNQWQALVQDTAYQISMISNQGETKWFAPLKGPIISGVFMVDIYKNNKLQYLFATPDYIYVIDRNGNLVEHYPINFPEEHNIQTLSLVDYNDTKKYRYFVSDEEGNLYLYNKWGDLLGDWTPKSMDAPLACPADHVRIGDKDCLYALQEDGKLFLFNRRGNLYSGFPVDLGEECSGKLFVRDKGNFDDSRLVTVTGKGKLIAVDFNGNIVRKKQVAGEGTFRIAYNPGKDDYVVAVHTDEGTDVYDAQLNTIIKEAPVNSSNFAVEYYEPADGNRIVVLTDKDEGKSYLYNGQGKLINSEGTQSEYEVGLIYYDEYDYYHVYKTYDNYLEVVAFRMPAVN